MYLTMTIEGATPEEIARGLDAAQAVFDQFGVTAMRAAEGRFAMEGWDIRGFEGEISAEDQKAFDVWCDAEQAALDACCTGWNEERKLLSVDLEIIDPYRGRDRLRSRVFRQIS